MNQPADHAAYRIHIKGIVQGVGFRPHVYRLATELELTGWVRNSSLGVFIEVEGTFGSLEQFTHRLLNNPPPLALIRDFSVQNIPWTGYENFSIRESQLESSREVMVSPDIAICEECRQDVINQENRRYLYPFTNCTNCGPRFTIIKDVPYDRAATTMAEFPMCEQCRTEYDNPMDRRFHAQPNACPVCGPQITLVNPGGQPADTDVRELLKQGAIVAVKSLGGLHLAADARNPAAVSALRARKKRDAKPFALMVRDMDTAEKYCVINPLEKSLLCSREAPIVVVRSRKGSDLAEDLIRPGLDTLGIFLPYTPLHFLLFDESLDVLIMTSANISDEPLITDNQTALEKLKDVADYFLLHNRDIYNPCDDSVICATADQTPHFFRRARGYVPGAIELRFTSKPVLAAGSEMKNTFCITRGREAYLSQHWGDLNHYHNYQNYLQGIERFQKMLNVKPEVVAYDLHPEYQASRMAKSLQGVQQIPVQHHHAHLASVMAEHGLEGTVLGLICDGTGLGTDGAIWGCELLAGDCKDFTRQGHLQYLPLIGGDLNAQRPYRMAFLYLQALSNKSVPLAERFLPCLSPAEMEIMQKSLVSRIPYVNTSSCGRLFDAVGAITGICPVNHYDGQAAVELEARADRSERGSYPFRIQAADDLFIMDVLPLWQVLIEDLLKNIPVEIISARFHNSMIELFADLLRSARDRTGLNRVVLSGGVFHNQILSSGLRNRLLSEEFQVFLNQQVPPGDGGISLGQAIIAMERVN